jgi:hypothetical protein
MTRFASLVVATVGVIALAACGGSGEPTPVPTVLPEDDAETAATLALVADRTEDLFALDGGDGPEITLLDDDALASLIAELLEDPESVESLRRDEAFYSLLGLIPPGTDLLALNEELLNAGIAGLYRPELDHLYVRLFGQFSSLEEATAAHEYAHYLQDVGYDLDVMFDTTAGDRDAELALRALIEGDASYVEQLYIAAHFNAVQLFGMGFGGLIAASQAPAVPYVFTRETAFVYVDGQSWVGDELSGGASRESLYAHPPLSTSEILHPWRYRGTEPMTVSPLEVAAAELPTGWGAGSSETIGELLLSIWLQELGAVGSSEAAAGWAADALRVFHDQDAPAGFVARIWWEAPEEADEFVSVATSALDGDPRYLPATCDGCQFELWDGPAGILALDQASRTADQVTLAVAPTLDDLEQILAAVR